MSIKDDPLIGRKLHGTIEIIRRIGEGGMGYVYEAYQAHLERRLAVKVMTPEHARNPVASEYFIREAKSASRLRHPNIIQIIDFGKEDDETLFLAMEFIPGRPLTDILAEEFPLTPKRVANILTQTLSGLEEAHAQGIVHRDLKPDNLMVERTRSKEDFVKILDFGIAKITENEDSNQAKLTQAGIVYGTPEYLSPEQAQALKLDRRTDIYSLGVMLYEMMTGQVPFMADSPVKILTKHVFEEPRRPNEIAGGRIAPTMENIILKAMKKDPKERFDNALDMFRALVRREQEILSSKGLGADANWVPGGELTGMFQAIEVKDMPAPARSPQRGQLPSKPLHAHAGEDNTVSMAMPQVTTATPATQQDDGTRKLVLVVIGIGLVILIILLAVIAMLLLNR